MLKDKSMTQTTNRRFSLRYLLALLIGAYALGLLIFTLMRLIFGDSLWWLAFFGNFTPFYFAALIVLLPLAVIVKARRGVVIMLPLAVFGLVTFGRPYLPKAAAQPAAESASFRLISFNVWGDNPDMSRIENWLQDQQADAVVTIELPPAWANGVPSLKAAYPQQITNAAQGIYWAARCFLPIRFSRPKCSI